jgi:hypothetical protein
MPAASPPSVAGAFTGNSAARAPERIFQSIGLTPAATTRTLMSDLSALHDMTLFVEVALTRYFSAAGRHLGVPVATLSRRIAAMEREFGVRATSNVARTSPTRRVSRRKPCARRRRGLAGTCGCRCRSIWASPRSGRCCRSSRAVRVADLPRPAWRPGAARGTRRARLRAAACAAPADALAAGARRRRNGRDGARPRHGQQPWPAAPALRTRHGHRRADRRFSCVTRSRAGASCACCRNGRWPRCRCMR